jgi:hypothetical protein
MLSEGPRGREREGNVAAGVYLSAAEPGGASVTTNTFIGAIDIPSPRSRSPSGRLGLLTSSTKPLRGINLQGEPRRGVRRACPSVLRPISRCICDLPLS